jgi:hypothetical protein
MLSTPHFFATEVPLGRVRLRPGPFKDRQDLHRTVLRHYDPDRLLHSFRVTAGLPAPGEPYEGWESPGCGLRGHFVGHYLSAVAGMAAATGDDFCRNRAGVIVAGLSACQVAHGNGYLSAFPATEFDTLETVFFDKVWAPYYTIHKIMAGLLDTHTHLGDTEALRVVTGMADYFAARLERLAPETMENLTRTDYCGNPVNEFGGVAESFLAVYAMTNDPRHLAAARCFLRPWFLDPLADGENKLAKLHANTHVPQALSFALASDVVDDPRLLEAAKFFFSQVTQRHTFAFGGNAFEEKFGPPGVESASFTDLTGETCNTHNTIRLARALFARTGDPICAAFHEHALVNHILASVSPDGGHTTYHVAAEPGRFKVYGHPHAFWCCSGTGIENTARYAEGLAFESGRTIWINLYLPSRTAFPAHGLEITQSSEFPVDDTIRFTISATAPVKVTLRLRIPDWLDGPARVDGSRRSEEAGYIVLEREWHHGDTFTLNLPMAVRVRPAMDDPGLVSFFHGPVLLAGALGRTDYPESDITYDQTAFHARPPAPVPALRSISPDALHRVPGQPLRYTAEAADGSNVTFLPFYELHHQRYALYWRAGGNAR